MKRSIDLSVVAAVVIEGEDIDAKGICPKFRDYHEVVALKDLMTCTNR